MLLIYPPMAKACEPPAGIARLAGALRGHGHNCNLLDANLEGLLHLLDLPLEPVDTWSRRAYRNRNANLAALRGQQLYRSAPRYQRAVFDLNRVLEMIGRSKGIALNLSNYQDENLSPLKSRDLLRAAQHPEKNIFYSYFAKRLPFLLEQNNPRFVGLSLNYLNQALTTFALLGFLRQKYPHFKLILGGGLVTSWLRNPAWRNPFTGLIDHFIAGPGEQPLLTLLGDTDNKNNQSQKIVDYQSLPLDNYLSPGFILPYAASSGCYWNNCLFCPEKAEGNPYHALPTDMVISDLKRLVAQTNPGLIHFLDNAVSPALMHSLIAAPPGPRWYGFARISPQLTDIDFCRALKKSGCVMLKLGLESGDQGVLDAMRKGINLTMTSTALLTLKKAGIATYVYLLFGTPSEAIDEARATLEFTARHHETITYLNLAIFNMPLNSPEAAHLAISDFYQGDLSLYTDFNHPKEWNRKEIRRFLAKEFKRHPAIVPIIKRDPAFFTSNHAPFFN